ncbi:MAG: oxygen-independent coproporphyrinogen III oxidase [Hyphomicrobium sp.]|jgi:oxygen-independent coproporphyrinogen-3 oxidase
MSPELVKRYSAPVPRYTSYPTAPHFSPNVSADTYRAWLAELPADVRLSLYFHIPFCDSLCWYCGCCTKAVQRYEPVAEYLTSLYAEAAHVAGLLPAGHEVAHIHWGGGSPNILTPDDIGHLAETHRRLFRVREDAEFAVEIDPRGLDDARIAAFARAGVTRVSLGIQDFDTKVQAAINRKQSFAETQAAVTGFRAHGVEALNVDLVYGLPHQTRASLQNTVEQVLELRPTRIAAFGYAHLPERLKHQRLIPTATLPDTVERFAQASRLARILMRSGYVRIGLDHFALPDDPLAKGQLARNFQGYTTDTADTLIGLGASAIGRLPQGYVQNHPATAEYARRIANDGLATSRGIALTDNDRMRGFVIERLMCDLAFPARELRTRYGHQSEEILREARALLEADQDRLIESDGEAFRVTDRGRPFVRTIAACFDSYLDATTARHAPGV